MLMRGDLNSIIERFNDVIEKAFNRILVLEDRVMALENRPEPGEAPKKGRPQGSKNRAK